MRGRRESDDPHHQAAWTLVELLTALAIVAILLGLLLPAIQASRRVADRTRCQANLRGWGQAVHAYLAARGHYPPAATWRVGERPDGRPIPARHSVFTYLLPFWDQATLATQVDLQRDWNHPANEPWTKQWLGGILICPAAPEGRAEKHPSDYTVAVRVDPSERTGLGRLLQRGLVRDRSGRGGPDWGSGTKVWDGILQLDVVDYHHKLRRHRPVRPRNVRDGASKTAMLIENAGKPICYRDGRPANCHITRFRWASPTLWMTINDVCRGQQLVNCHNNSQPYSFHTGGLNLLYADGSVHWTSESIAADLFVSSITLAGND